MSNIADFIQFSAIMPAVNIASRNVLSWQKN